MAGFVRRVACSTNRTVVPSVREFFRFDIDLLIDPNVLFKLITDKQDDTCTLSHHQL